MTGAERARKARRRRKWLRLLDDRQAGRAVDSKLLAVLVEEFGAAPAPLPIDLDGPHEPSATAAQAHLTRGGTVELRECEHGCHAAWREHRRPLEAEAARRYRASHVYVRRESLPDPDEP